MVVARGVRIWIRGSRLSGRPGRGAWMVVRYVSLFSFLLFLGLRGWVVLLRVFDVCVDVDANVVWQDWLALPLDPLLSQWGADITQTAMGPDVGGFDMLDVLLNYGGPPGGG